MVVCEDPFPAAEVVATKYSDCDERALLLPRLRGLMRAAGEPRDLDISRCIQGDMYETVCRWLVEVFNDVDIDDDALFGVIDVSRRYLHIVMKPQTGGTMQTIVMGALGLVLKERYGRCDAMRFSPREVVQHLCHNQVDPKLLQQIENELLQRVDRICRPHALSFLTVFCTPLFSIDRVEWNDGLEVGPAELLIHGYGTRRPAIYHLASRLLHVLLFVAPLSVCIDKPAVVVGSAALFTALWIMRAPRTITRTVGNLVGQVVLKETKKLRNELKKHRNELFRTVALKESLLLASNLAIGLSRRDGPAALEEKFASATRCNVLRWERHESEIRDLWEALDLEMPRERFFKPITFGTATN